jgi:hypothetical protein
MSAAPEGKPVWVDLTTLFARADGAAEGIDLDRPAPGGLIKWLRTSAGG